jgi:hypothetical protein
LECPIKREGPEAREGHRKTVIAIFGGCGKSTDNNYEVYNNDIYIYIEYR